MNTPRRTCGKPELKKESIFLQDLVGFRTPPAIRRVDSSKDAIPLLLVDRLNKYVDLKHVALSNLLASGERKGLFWLDVQLFNRLLYRNHHALYKSREFRQLKLLQRYLKRFKMLKLGEATSVFVDSFYSVGFKGAKGKIDALPSLRVFLEFGQVAVAAIKLFDAMALILRRAYLFQKQQMQQTLFMSQSVLFMAIICRVATMSASWRLELSRFMERYYWKLGECVYGSARTVDGRATEVNRAHEPNSIFRLKKSSWKNYRSFYRVNFSPKSFESSPSDPLQTDPPKGTSTNLPKESKVCIGRGVTLKGQPSVGAEELKDAKPLGAGQRKSAKKSLKNMDIDDIFMSLV